MRKCTYLQSKKLLFRVDVASSRRRQFLMRIYRAQFDVCKPSILELADKNKTKKKNLCFMV